MRDLALRELVNWLVDWRLDAFAMPNRDLRQAAVLLRITAAMLDELVPPDWVDTQPPDRLAEQ